MSSLCVIVPARGGSRRLPKKNLRRLGGVPLLEWTLRGLRAAGIEQTPLLSTDDDEIAAEGKRLGFAVPFMRPPELGRDDTPTIDVVLHALKEMSNGNVLAPDLVMLLQLTSPFRPPELLREGLKRMQSNSDADALVAVKALSVGLNHVYRAAGPFLSRVSETDGTAYVPSGALYIVRTASLRKFATFMPPNCIWLNHAGFSALDIDTEDDWTIAQAALAAGCVSLPQ